MCGITDETRRLGYPDVVIKVGLLAYFAPLILLFDEKLNLWQSIDIGYHE
jgi:hypothetical protein